MDEALIAVLLMLFATKTQGISLCSINKQFYDVKGNISLDLGAGGADKVDVDLYGQVALERLENYTKLQVKALSMTDYRENVYPNPNGIDKPVQVVVDDRGGYGLISEPDDSVTSIALKRHLINLLPRQAITKATDNPNISKIKATQTLLKRGDHEIILSDDYKELIVVLGNTGAGKSTLTQWIAGDSSRLVAKEVVEGEYIIEDNFNRIGNSTIDSKTTFPELIIDKENNEAYYDFPGFSDTRDSSYDIATSYFIKRTLDHSKAVKMLFVVSYPSVRKGVDRQDFLKLLRHLSELIKDMHKFHNSIALVVTKVDNQIVFKRGIPTLVDDSKIVAGIAKFLEEAKNDLKHRFSIPNPSSKDLTFYKNSIRFIDAIMEKQDNKYTRIGIFRRPSEPGPLNKMTTLQEEKERLSKMMHVILKYTEKLPDDFGRTVSDRSKNFINDLIQEIDKTILYSTCSLAENLQKYFFDLQMQLNIKINITNSNNIAEADKQLVEIRNLLRTYTNDFYVIKELTSSIEHMKNNEDVSQLISETVTSLELPALSESAKEILFQGRYLKFLYSISDTESNSRISPLAWASSFHNILTEQSVNLSHIQNHIDIIESEISNEIQYEVTKIGEDLLQYFSKEEENLSDIFEVIDKLKFHYNKMSRVIYIDNTSDYIDYIIKITTDLKINTSEGVKICLTRDTRHFDQLKNVINEVIEYLNTSQFWYTFLNRLHEQLLTYKIQKDKNIYYNLLKPTYHHDDGKKVSEVGLQIILKEIFNNDSRQLYESLKNVTLDKNKRRNLGLVVSVTLKQPDQSCVGDKMIIKGIVIKTSDVLQMICPYDIRLNEIFAASKLIIDSDLTEENLDLTIIAPTWEIQGKRYIKLAGKTGSLHKELKAQNGHYSSEDGQDGEPGSPGYQGGSLLGIGKTFINGEQLIVASIGGTGGPGQNGGDGANGANGDNPHIYNPEQYLKSIGWYDDSSKYSCFLFFYCDYKTLEGGRCTNGGKPGLGGSGGLGGKPGKIHIISTNNDRSNITTITVPGAGGKAGSQGREGRAGRPGKYLKFNWRLLTFNGHTQYEVEDTKYCNDGEERTVFPNNLNGIFKNRTLPSNYTLNEADTVKDFKIFMSQILNNTVTASDIKDFLDALENTPGMPDRVVFNTSNIDEDTTRSYNTENVENMASTITINESSDISTDETTTSTIKYNYIENENNIGIEIETDADKFDYRI